MAPVLGRAHVREADDARRLRRPRLPQHQRPADGPPARLPPLQGPGEGVRAGEGAGGAGEAGADGARRLPFGGPLQGRRLGPLQAQRHSSHCRLIGGLLWGGFTEVAGIFQVNPTGIRLVKATIASALPQP